MRFISFYSMRKMESYAILGITAKRVQRALLNTQRCFSIIVSTLLLGLPPPLLPHYSLSVTVFFSGWSVRIACTLCYFVTSDLAIAIFSVPVMFLPSVAVFCTEIIKLFVCLSIVLYQHGDYSSCLTLLTRQVVLLPLDTFKVCVPAIIYTIQNNLFYLAASHLDAATFMVTSQLKIFSTAIFFVVLLEKSLSRIQWMALSLLFLGVSLVQIQQNESVKDSDQMKPLIGGKLCSCRNISITGIFLFFLCFICTLFSPGFVAVMVASALSGFAGVYFEKILKSSTPVSLWVRNIQLSVFSLPVSLLASFVQDGHYLLQNGLFSGFDALVWLMIVWYAVGGLSVAVCIKYADNISKNFATSVAIIISTVASVYIFQFQPTSMFIIGALFVIVSIFIYSTPIVSSSR